MYLNICDMIAIILNVDSKFNSSEWFVSFFKYNIDYSNKIK